MKIFVGITFGILLTLIFVGSKIILSPPTERESAILVSILNDTDHSIKLITFESDDGQFFSCSLRFKLCSMAFLNTGDVSFKITADLESGLTLKGDIGYAEPGSNHKILVSKLVDKNT